LRQVSLNVRGYLGTAPARSRVSSLVWWLGPTFLFKDTLSASQIMVMAQRGPRYAGTFANNRSQNSSTDSDVEFFISSSLSSITSNPAATTTLDWFKPRESAVPTDKRAPSTIAAGSRSKSSDTISFEQDNIVFAFHAQAFFELSTLAPLVLMRSAQPYGGNGVRLHVGLQTVIGLCGATAPGIMLPNSASAPLHPSSLQWLLKDQAASEAATDKMATSSVSADMKATSVTEIAWPAGFLSGGAFPLLPLNLADAIRMVGGMRAVLPLLSRASTTSAVAFKQALILIGAFLHQNPKNMQEMTRLQGYEMCAMMLASRSEWLDKQLLEIIFAIVEGRDYLHDVVVSPAHKTIHQSSVQVVYFERDYRLHAVDTGDQSQFTRHIIHNRGPNEPPFTLVANALACKHILLDFHVWRNANPSIQAAVFKKLAHMCHLGPKCGEISTPIFSTVSSQSLNTARGTLIVKGGSPPDANLPPVIKRPSSQFSTSYGHSDMLVPVAVDDDDDVGDDWEQVSAPSGSWSVGSNVDEFEGECEAVVGEEMWNVQRLKQIGVWGDILNALCDQQLGVDDEVHAALVSLFEGILLDGISTRDLNATLSFLAVGASPEIRHSSNGSHYASGFLNYAEPGSLRNKSKARLCSSLLDVITMTLMVGVDSEASSHTYRIVSQLSSIDFKWFCSFFAANVAPCVSTAIMKLICMLLQRSSTFSQRWVAQKGFLIFRMGLDSVRATPEIYAMLIALLLGYPADSVVRQGEWREPSFDAATLFQVFKLDPSFESKLAFPEFLEIILHLITRAIEKQSSTAEIQLALVVLQFLNSICPISRNFRVVLQNRPNLSALSAICFSVCLEDAPAESDDAVEESQFPMLQDLAMTSFQILCRLIMQSLMDDEQPMHMLDFILYATPLYFSDVHVQTFQSKIFADVAFELRTLLHQGDLDLDVEYKLLVHSVSILELLIDRLRAQDFNSYTISLEVATHWLEDFCFLLNHAEFFKKLLRHTAISSSGSGAVASITQAYRTAKRSASDFMESAAATLSTTFASSNRSMLVAADEKNNSAELMHDRAHRFESLVDDVFRYHVHRLCIYVLAAFLDHSQFLISSTPAPDTMFHLPIATFMAIVTTNSKVLYGPEWPVEAVQSLITMFLTYLHRFVFQLVPRAISLIELRSQITGGVSLTDAQQLLEHSDLFVVELFDSYVELVKSMATWQKPWLQQLLGGQQTSSGDNVFVNLVQPLLSSAVPTLSGAPSRHPDLPVVPPSRPAPKGSSPTPINISSIPSFFPFSSSSVVAFIIYLAAHEQQVSAMMLENVYRLNRDQFVPAFRTDTTHRLPVGISGLSSSKGSPAVWRRDMTIYKTQVKQDYNSSCERSERRRNRYVADACRLELRRQDRRRQEAAYRYNHISLEWKQLQKDGNQSVSILSRWYCELFDSFLIPRLRRLAFRVISFSLSCVTFFQDFG
jgi:hypothetical protein